MICRNELFGEVCIAIFRQNLAKREKGGKRMSVVIGGLYEHYKGKKYKVIGVAKHSETLERMVVYKACYGNEDLWVRPYNMFCENITVNGTVIERFKYLGEELASICKVYLELPEDIMCTLNESGINLEKEITRTAENVTIQYEQTDENGHKKDVALVVLAAGVSVSAILLCVVRIIRAINERPREVKIIEKSADGRIIKEKTTLLEPHKVPQKTEFDFEAGTQSIKLKFSDGVYEGTK